MHWGALGIAAPGGLTSGFALPIYLFQKVTYKIPVGLLLFYPKTCENVFNNNIIFHLLNIWGQWRAHPTSAKVGLGICRNSTNFGEVNADCMGTTPCAHPTSKPWLRHRGAHGHDATV